MLVIRHGFTRREDKKGRGECSFQEKFHCDESHGCTERVLVPKSDVQKIMSTCSYIRRFDDLRFVRTTNS